MSHLDSWGIIAGHLAEVPARIANREAVAVQIPVGEVERRSLEVYELAAGGAR